jgi:hypothetical protein
MRQLAGRRRKKRTARCHKYLPSKRCVRRRAPARFQYLPWPRHGPGHNKRGSGGRANVWEGRRSRQRRETSHRASEAGCRRRRLMRAARRPSLRGRVCQRSAHLPPEAVDQARPPVEEGLVPELEGAAAGNLGKDWSPVRRRASPHTLGHADPPPVLTHDTQQKGQPPSDGGARKDARRGHWYVLHINDTPVISPRITLPLLRLPAAAPEASPPPLATDAAGAV